MILKQISGLNLFKSIVALTAFVFLFFYYFLYQSNVQNEKNQFISKKLYELKVLNYKLDSFALHQRSLTNYDLIQKDIEKFYKNLEFFEKSDFYSEYGGEFQKVYEKIKDAFYTKEKIIQKYKMYKSTMLFSLENIISTGRKLRLGGLRHFKNKQIVFANINKVVSNLFRTYLGFSDDSNVFSHSLVELVKINRELNSIGLEAFIDKAKQLKGMLNYTNEILKEYEKIELAEDIEQFGKLFEKKIESIKTKQSVVLNLIFIFISLMLFVISFGYFKNQRLKEELLSFRYAVENSDDSVVVTDKERRIIYVNEAFCKNTGYTKEEALRQNPRILQSGRLPKEFYQEMNEILDRGERWSGEFINKDKFGNIFYEKASITPMFLSGELKGYLAIKLNITDYVKQKREVEFLAYHDSLTKLSNRVQLKIDLQNFINESKDSNLNFDLLFLDLDGFKYVNDTLGHNVGDLLLKKVAFRLNRFANQNTFVYRTGGDEFAIVSLYKTSISPSAKLAIKIIDAINRPTITNKHRLKVGVSIGIAKYDKKNDDILNLLKHADIAMYEAKMKGKNRFKFYTKAIFRNLHRKMQIEALLPRAIKDKEMYVVYQPKYDLNSKKIISYEALLRWQSKELGLVRPDHFIPIAEYMSVINDIGLFVLENACRDFVELLNANRDLKSISVNLSPAQLTNRSLMEEFHELAKRYNLSNEAISFEITETSLMKNIKRSSEILNNLNELGFKVELDDFGTGYSSMSYLKNLPVSKIKIDKSFVDSVTSDENDVAIVRAVVSISKSFGFKTVAEGIESVEQERVLRDLGVDYGQGYYFSKPKRKEELV